jgi:hypothetical protein
MNKPPKSNNLTSRSKIILRNDFHATQATVIALDDIISARAMRRAENKLCGLSDCKCGGLRGPQDVYLVPINYAGDYLVAGERR